jgi:hypothetical protein
MDPAELPSWLDDNFYAMKLQPVLKNVSISLLANAFEDLDESRLPIRKRSKDSASAALAEAGGVGGGKRGLIRI